MDDLFEEESSQEQEPQYSPETLAPITISLPIAADRRLESVTLLKLPPFTMVQKDPFDPNTYSERSDLFYPIAPLMLKIKQNNCLKLLQVLR